ncbi:hypothetical protein acdb102_13610 [Acidothermaceae bacterium B102]|nr:hypothetical protein acdb102_13610 [Acidothermaceae bacterium B102]
MPTAQLHTRPQALLADAIVAHATLVGRTTDGRHIVDLSVLVVAADQTTESVSLQVSVTPRDLSRVYPGASLTVRHDPSRPAQLRLPWFLNPSH